MKKRFVLLSIAMILAFILLAPNQAVLANVIVTEVGVTGTPLGPPICEKVWTDGGVTHMRNCVMNVMYTSADPRLTGISELVMSRNIFSEIGYPARGHGTWMIDPSSIEGGYWAGTFTANIDETGYMTVNIIGKGYGVLDGLFFENTTHGIGGEDIVLITQVPSYDGP